MRVECGDGPGDILGGGAEHRGVFYYTEGSKWARWSKRWGGLGHEKTHLKKEEFRSTERGKRRPGDFEEKGGGGDIDEFIVEEKA